MIYIYIYIICALYLSVYTCSHTCICISLFAHTQHVLKVEISPNTSGRTPCGSATAWPLAVKLPAAAPFDALQPPSGRTERRRVQWLGISQSGHNEETAEKHMGVDQNPIIINWNGMNMNKNHLFLGSLPGF